MNKFVAGFRYRNVGMLQGNSVPLGMSRFVDQSPSKLAERCTSKRFVKIKLMKNVVKCVDVPKEVCQQVAREHCKTVPRQTTTTRIENDCRTVQDQSCRQVPRQACEQKPQQVTNYVDDILNSVVNLNSEF